MKVKAAMGSAEKEGLRWHGLLWMGVDGEEKRRRQGRSVEAGDRENKERVRLQGLPWWSLAGREGE